MAESCRLITTEQYQEYQLLKKKLEIALCTLGIIAMHSTDRVDAVQAAVAIEQIKEVDNV